MPVPSLITDLSTVAGSNSPAGSETPGQGDDYLRVLSAFLAQLRDQLNGTANVGTLKNPVFSGAATGTLTGLPTISATTVTWSGNPTHSGNHTFSGNVSAQGNTTLGDASADTATVNATTTFPLAVTTHTFGLTVGNVARAGSTTLDWYEENNALSMGVFSTGGTPSISNAASFTRVGNRVSVNLIFSVTAWNGSTGAISFTNLPYAAAEDTILAAGYGEGSTASAAFIAVVYAGTTSIAIKTVAGANYTPATAGLTFSGNAQGTYRV